MSNIQSISEQALRLRINILECAAQAQMNRAEISEDLTSMLGDLVESQACLLDEAINEANFLAETLVSLREARDQALNRVTELASKVDVLERARDDAKPTLDALAMIDELETQLAGVRAENEDLLEYVATLEEENEALNDETQGLQREVDDLADELEDRPNKHDYCQIEDALADSTERLEVLQLEIESRDELINELKRALRNVKAKLKRRESKD